MICQRRAIVSVPGEIARREWAVPVRMVHGALGKELARSAHEFVRNFALAGYEYIDTSDVHVYGPFPSRTLLEPMLDAETMAVTEHEAQALVLDSDHSEQAFAHYLLCADFNVAAQAVLSKGE